MHFRKRGLRKCELRPIDKAMRRITLKLKMEKPVSCRAGVFVRATACGKPAPYTMAALPEMYDGQWLRLRMKDRNGQATAAGAGIA